MLTVKILGSGCANCRKLEAVAREAATIANDNQYGLAAGVWTRDIGKAHSMAARLRAGTVWINTYNNFDSASPYGGYKQSGFGRLNGKEVMDEMTQVKSVWVNLK